MYTQRAMRNYLTAFCFLTPRRDRAVKVLIALLGDFLGRYNAMRTEYETLHEVAEMLDKLAADVLTYKDSFTGQWVPVVSQNGGK